MRWSPHCKPGCQRFLVVNVADPGLVLNEVDNITKNDISYHVVSRSGRMGNFGAFDWSKTDESTVALGHSSGIASLVKFRYDGQPCDTVAQFRIKQQRKCNSIAFSTQDWLAVAVDRARSDVCLFIYDANREDGGTSSTVRRLCAAEVVSSVRFFPSQPQEIVASTGRQSIRLYDLRGELMSQILQRTETYHYQIAAPRVGMSKPRPKMLTISQLIRWMKIVLLPQVPRTTHL